MAVDPVHKTILYMIAELSFVTKVKLYGIPGKERKEDGEETAPCQSSCEDPWSQRSQQHGRQSRQNEEENPTH